MNSIKLPLESQKSFYDLSNLSEEKTLTIFKIAKGPAAASITKDGKKISANTKDKTRLQLSTDNRFHIAVKTQKNLNISKNKKNKEFIELIQNQEPIYINIKSLTKRLGVSKTKIEKAQEEGKLILLLQERIKIQEKTFAEYEKIMNAYGNSKQLEKETDVTYKILIKAVRKAVSHFFKETSINEINDNQKNNDLFAFYKNGMFLASMPNNHLKLIVRTSKELGIGGYGAVYESVAIKDGIRKEYEQYALKEARDYLEDSPFGNKYYEKLDQHQEKAQENIRAEYQMLTLVHTNNPNQKIPLRGIQSLPLKFIEIKSQKNDKFLIVAYLGEKYDGDLLKCLEQPINIKLQQGANIFAGLAYLKKNGIVHRDLKFKNILIKHRKEGITSHICDFASGMQLDKEKGSGKIKGNKLVYVQGAHSKYYTSLVHKNMAKKAWKKGDIELSNQILHENDLFAAGKILYELFAGADKSFKDPCNYDKDGYIIDSQGFDSVLLNKQNVPQKIIQMLEKLLKSKPGEMISIEEALDQYEEAINSPL